MVLEKHFKEKKMKTRLRICAIRLILNLVQVAIPDSVCNCRQEVSAP